MEYKKHPYWTNIKSNRDGVVIGPRGTALKPMLHHTGYSVITARKPGIQKQLRLHRVIWECFNGVIQDNSMIINHIDGNKTNNSLDNLELVTHSDNVIHSWSLGLSKPKNGEDNPGSKISNLEAEMIIESCINGVNDVDIGNSFSLHPGYVNSIRHRKRWIWLWDEMGL